MSKFIQPMDQEGRTLDKYICVKGISLIFFINYFFIFLVCWLLVLWKLGAVDFGLGLLFCEMS
jgi:hypothetical protein